MPPARHHRPIVLVLLLLLLPAARADDGVFAQVVDKARALASKTYQEPEPAIPKALAKLDYARYRDIRFDKDEALWKGQGRFTVEFFHPGFVYDKPVRIHEVDHGEVTTVPFDPARFDYGDNVEVPDQVPPDLGYAGFRVHFPLNRADYKDEVIAFLGASYFRMVGRGQRYGLSARGLAIDTALPQGEEFPVFREFWLVRPTAEADSLRFYALLDSPSLTGAYQFDLTPGGSTRLEVHARLFARKDVHKLGIAPLTSMFLFGDNSVRHFDDYRVEVHDSDGLLMHTGGGEWIWRPLSNRARLRVSAFTDDNIRGFGLAQRDRDFGDYLDAESRYERRPSLWVVPEGSGWGKGAVQLVEIPTDEEVNDNIVAFWVPDDPLRAGQERDVAYRLETFGARPEGQELATVRRTRIGWGAIPGSEHKPPKSLRQFIVDFDGGELTGLDASQHVRPELTTTSGQLKDVTVERLPDGQGWRASFKLQPDADQPADMRLYLTLDDQRLSETWSYVWYPTAIEE